MEVVFKHENLRLEALKYIKKTYQCLICDDNEFIFQSDVLKHVEEIHLEIIIAPQIKNEFSENCMEKKEMNQIENEFKELRDMAPKPELMNTRLALISPKKNIHERKKKYKCSICSKDFPPKEPSSVIDSNQGVEIGTSQQQSQAVQGMNKKMDPPLHKFTHF